MPASDKLAEPCARCDERAVVMCADCGDMLCRLHVEPAVGSAPWSMRARAGSNLGMCPACHRARFWRWTRGAGTLAAVGVAFMLWMESAPTAALGALGVAVGWFVLATLLARGAAATAAAERRES